MQSVHQVPQAPQKSLKMYHINEDYPTSDQSGDKTLQIYTKACFCTITFECCRELRRGLQSGFLKHHVIVSVTISYKGTGRPEMPRLVKLLLHLSQASLIMVYT